MKNILIENNNYLNKFFHKEKKYELFIKNQINNTEMLIKERPYKIKTVRGCKYRNKTIWEYKIPLEENLSCRVAYIIENNNIIIFFISTTIIKIKFTKLVIDFLKNNN